MLKWLELIGFKSFADKTRFKFDAGLTGIVGPNGSGKSNIIDAVRWILGEQSAKSLRGKEMADVIFNGSSTRRSLGMAEVSLCLDNHHGYLPIESAEVVLTRRVYRSGEGEYLINGQQARLRDIRNLFLGTGAGAGAYSIIAQGKVDLMLQSSTKERRHIFEEAAGISKFRARKIEALRRLDRVDQNLLRVQDIQEEVEKQLRSLRNQAGKARSFKQHSDRLRELRLTLGLADYHSQAASLTALEERAAKARNTIDQSQEALGEARRQHQQIDETLTQQEELVRKLVEQQSEIRKRTSVLETELAADQSRQAELSEEMLEGNRRLIAARRRLAEAEQQYHGLKDRHRQETLQRQAQAVKLDQCQASLAELTGRLRQLEEERQQTERQSQERLQALSKLENEHSGLESQLGLLWQQRERLAEKQAELARQIDGLTARATSVAAQREAAWAQLCCCRKQAAGLGDQHRALLDRRQKVLEDLTRQRDRVTALASRIDVLKNLQDRQEGLKSGVREALARREQNTPPWKCVLGVLAESLQVPAEYADLVELALGENAQALVVNTDNELTEELMAQARALGGRVQFLPIEDDARGDRLIVFADDMPWTSLSSLVECPEHLRPLIERLLGTTFLVDDYPTAQQAIAEDADLRLVTATGEVLQPDGLVSAGPARAASGILSRAAELRQLNEQLEEASAEIVTIEQALADVEEEISTLDSQLHRHARRDSVLADQCRHFDSQLSGARQRRRGLQRQQQANTNELGETVREIEQIDEQYLRTEHSLTQTHEEIRQLTDRTGELHDSIRQATQSRQSAEAETTSIQMELAVIDERLVTAQSQCEQFEADLAHRRREAQEQADRVEAACRRQRDLERRLLRCGAQLAEAYSEKDQLVAHDGADPAEHERLRARRRELAEEVEKLQTELDVSRRGLHEDELRVTELRLGRDTLLSRIQEDYAIDLAELQPGEYAVPSAEEAEAFRLEIEQLREKLSRLGNVNLQAIEELEGLELRADTLRFQINDLTTAKRHLEEVITKINEESRRLFLDTFETVRGHFQQMFRKLFGGGMADILLEDETDMLETGIEIIARPPGKEPRSISLLSGGEKTLTAVAMVMALFRSKPSPYCILDEVDAALDEANIGRFVALLREFLDQSQFIIVTHSKTTMASADVLHGVTQRESGVSIRVSVRLEDINEKGEIAERDEAHEESA